MPTKTTKANLNASTPEILNAIRNSSSAAYQNVVPIATSKNFRSVGQAILGNPTFQNEFLNNLVNRIGYVMVSSKMYSNPWNYFKKGLMEYGESIEEIFVNIAQAHTYDIETAESQVFKREIPDVASAFHLLNYRTFYKATIQEEQLRQAFLSLDGVTDLIARITDAMYSGANYDEFLTMKYMLAKHILDGTLYPVTIPETTPQNMKQIASAFKKVSNDLEFMSTQYNQMGVNTYTNKDEQYLIINSGLDASLDVEVLASAFNMDRAEFMGHRVLVDSFGKLDNKRLGELMADDPNYVELTDDELAQLDAIPAVLVSRDWFQIYDNMQKFTEIYNSQGLYWNYFLHVWKIFSVSPFSNGVSFVAGTPSVTGVTLTPATASVAAGGSVQLTAAVSVENMAPQSVTYSVTGNATVSDTGLVSVNSDASANDTITVTATSTFDTSKSASSTITVS